MTFIRCHLMIVSLTVFPQFKIRQLQIRLIHHHFAPWRRPSLRQERLIAIDDIVKYTARGPESLAICIATHRLQ
jgi:hypothetical protein